MPLIPSANAQGVLVRVCLPRKALGFGTFQLDSVAADHEASIQKLIKQDLMQNHLPLTRAAPVYATLHYQHVTGRHRSNCRTNVSQSPAKFICNALFAVRAPASARIRGRFDMGGTRPGCVP